MSDDVRKPTAADLPANEKSAGISRGRGIGSILLAVWLAITDRTLVAGRAAAKRQRSVPLVYRLVAGRRGNLSDRHNSSAARLGHHRPGEARRTFLFDQTARVSDAGGRPVLAGETDARLDAGPTTSK